MAFEFFFGLLGLISSDSKSRHKSRLESEWRLPTPLNANLFRDSGFKSPNASAGSPTSNFKSDGNQSASNGQKRPIFSTSGTLAAANSGSVSEGLFSSTSSSSASSIASSGSNLTTNSTSAFIKPSEHTKKYEFRLNLIGEKGAGANLNSSSMLSDDNLISASLKGTTTTSSTADLLSSDSQNEQQAAAAADEQKPSASGASVSRTQRLRRLYCLIVCACLWLNVARLITGLLVERSLFTLDFYCLGTYKIHFLIPAMCLAIQAAAVSTLFIRNNDETNWLVPFYSSKDYLIRSRSNFKPKIEDYTKRVNVSIVLALVLALVSSISLSAYLMHCVGQSDIILANQLAAASAAASSNGQQSQLTQYETIGSGSSGSSGSSSLAPTSSYGPSSTTMSTIISLQQQEQQLNRSQQEAGSGGGGGAGSGSNSLESSGGGGANNNNNNNGVALDLSSTNRLERATLATLLALDVLWTVYSTYICFLVSFYFNLICSIMKSRFHGISKIIEDLAESNTTKTTNQARKITTLYLEHNEACELLDESNDFWQYLIFFTYFTYIPAYCYCLYNLFFVDFDAWPSFITWVIHTHTGFIILLISFSAAGVSTEIATFLHRVRGLTIGYSCYDLFAITNASMSNTAAACASYFLIVADFSRSSVFTLAQMNGSTSAGGAAPVTPTPGPR